MRTRNLVVILAAVLVAGLVFWPTMWQYDRYGGGASALPMRTNRLTGAVELMFPGSGWVSQTPTRIDPARLQVLPDSELSKLTGTGGFEYGGSFHAALYNGSNWTVSEVEYSIKVVPANPLQDLFSKGASPNWSRTFRSSVRIRPFTTSRDFFTVGDVPEDSRAEWKIVSAKGMKE